MQAHAEIRKAARDVRGFFGVGLIHHHARMRQQTRRVAALHGTIDACAAAEVVASEDESFQNTNRAGTLARDPDVFAILPVSTQGMNWLAIVFGGISFAGIVHACLAARFAWSLKIQPLAKADSPPLTLLRPVKAGVPHLQEKLVALAKAMRPGDRLVLGVNERSDDVKIAETVRREFPEREIVVVLCRKDGVLNPKISKLLQMDSAAAGEHLVLSDSEAIIDEQWLDAFRADWAASGADAITCGYRFIGANSWTQTLDAAPTLFSLWPGLLFVRRFGRLNFTLGACTGLRRSDLARVGGWPAFGDDLAEDNRLGAALDRAGKTIRLSKQVVALESDPLTWREYWRHQRRVAVTYRICNPAGFAGMIFTRSVTAGLLCIAFAPGHRLLAVAVFLGVQMIRLLCFQCLACATGFSRARLFAAMLVSDVVESLCWVFAWLAPTVFWAGKRWCISSEGKLREG